jgi:iron complex outermembrane recepter protein
MRSIYFIILLLLTQVIVSLLPLKAIGSAGDELQEFKGRVVHAINGSPIAGANIYLAEFKQGTTTDVDGYFSLQIKQGNQAILLQVSFVGYKTQLLRIQPHEWQTELRIALEEESLMEREVMVSAGRIASRDEIPVLVDRMGLQQMRQTGELNSMSALVNIPGVEQIVYGTGIGKPVIRGMSFSRILSMYQGSRFENQQWGADHGLGVNDLGIEAVEVIKGPASFLYGSGAVGGVVYLVDERPAPRGQWLAESNSTFHSNTLGLRQTFGLRETKQNGWFYGLYAGMENHADYIDGNGRTIGNSRFNTYTLRANTGLQKKWGQIKLAYSFHQQHLGIIEDDELEESLATFRNDRSIQLPFQDIQDHLISLSSIVQLGKGRLESSLSHHINFRKEIEDELDEVDLGLIQQNTTFDTKWFFERGPIEHIIGAQGFVLSNRNMDDVEEILIPDATVLDASLYYLATLRKGNTTWQGGFRYDSRSTTGDASSPTILDYGYRLPGLPVDQLRHTVSHSGWSGSAGFIQQFGEHLNLKSNFSSGFRAPDLAELFSNGEHPGTQRFEVGNVSFAREQNFQWDLALQYQSKRFNAEFTPFVNWVFNYIYFNPTTESVEGTDLLVWSFEQDDARLMGGEIHLRYRPLPNDKLELSSAYSMIRGLNASSGDFLPLMPADRLISRISWRMPASGWANQWRLNLSHHYVWEQSRLSLREQQVFDDTSTPFYQLINLGAGANLKLGKQVMIVDIMANNLLNAAYVDHLSFLRPFGINNIGRNVSINVNLPFGNR